MFSACLLIFQLCGFYPVQITVGRNNSSSRLSKAIANGTAFIHFLLTSSFILFMAIEQDKMLYSKTVIGKFNDILIYFSLLAAHLSIVIESFMRRRYFSKYWNFYDELVKLNRKSINIKWYRGYIMKFMLYMCFTIGIESLVITSINGWDEQWTNFWYAEIYSLLATRVRHIQHVFFIDVIFFTLQDLNERMKYLILWTTAAGGDKKFCQKHFYIKLSRMKEQFKNLMEMIICVNRIFRWSQVLNFGQHFIELVAEPYWIYAFATGPPPFLYGNFIVFSCMIFIDLFLFYFSATCIVFLPTVLVLLLLMQSATRCIKEVSVTWSKRMGDKRQGEERWS